MLLLTGQGFWGPRGRIHSGLQVLRPLRCLAQMAVSQLLGCADLRPGFIPSEQSMLLVWVPLQLRGIKGRLFTGPVNGAWGFSGASSVEWSRGKQIVGLELILPCHFSSTELCGEPPLPGGEWSILPR